MGKNIKINVRVQRQQRTPQAYCLNHSKAKKEVSATSFLQIQTKENPGIKAFPIQALLQ
jgi:hypothetical protein